jgi:hypothetical protein
MSRPEAVDGKTHFEEQFDLLVSQTGGMSDSSREMGRPITVDSYRYKDCFILLSIMSTSKEKLESFWRLVSDIQVRCIVTFADNDYVDGTPDRNADSQNWGCYKVSLASAVDTNGSSLRFKTLKVTNESDKKMSPLLVRHFVFNGWRTDEAVPSTSRSEFIRLIRYVEDWKMETGVPSSPTILQCGNGVTQNGLFCASYIVCEKMSLEGCVDVYHTVKALKMKKQDIVSSLEQYKFCFKALWDYTKLKKKIKHGEVDNEVNLMKHSDTTKHSWRNAQQATDQKNNTADNDADMFQHLGKTFATAFAVQNVGASHKTAKFGTFTEIELSNRLSSVT